MALLTFTVRIGENDGIDTEAFSQAVKDRGDSREELIRELIRGFLSHVDEEENYYTIKGYSDDHTRYAEIVNMGGDIYDHSEGFEYKSSQWLIIEHAKDLVERGDTGDKEEAIKLLKGIFGEKNVFVKKAE